MEADVQQLFPASAAFAYLARLSAEAEAGNMRGSMMRAAASKAHETASAAPAETAPGSARVMPATT